MKLLGPFTQLLTMDKLPLKGAIPDECLEIIEQGGVLVEKGIIAKVGDFKKLKNEYTEAEIEHVKESTVAMPGFVDTHTHICSAGSRAGDYAMRIAGKSYLEIAKLGGGIWSTVQHTRKAGFEDLKTLTEQRAGKLLKNGVTTCEVKSGYCLDTEGELKMLKVINTLDKELAIDLVATCLAAHIKPKDFEGTEQDYLQQICEELLPEVKKQKLSKRVDIFVEQSAFSIQDADKYLEKVGSMGFELVVHADQFTAGGSQLAVKHRALSADHLEASTDKEIKLLGDSDVVCVGLPGASLGLGDSFLPARKLLDAGASLAIASDWNPGSAPMGDLLTQAAILSTYERLSAVEVFAALTIRAAVALKLSDRGVLKKEKQADIIAFPCSDYKEILYRQGTLKPLMVWKKGKLT